jgi:hypothetical protein
MSNWTHVAGIIRVDRIRVDDDVEELDFDEILGKECLNYSSREVWDDARKHPDKYLPMGSEGSLQKTVWENPDRGRVASYTVSIFGDLRDYEGIPSDIIDWFIEKCNLLWVRSAVITVDNDLHGTETYTY